MVSPAAVRASGVRWCGRPCVFYGDGLQRCGGAVSSQGARCVLGEESERERGENGDVRENGPS